MKSEALKRKFRIERLLKYGCILTGLFLILACHINGKQQEKSDSEKLRVLFIGNSLTYVNNLPKIVAELARSAKQKKLDFKMVAHPDYGLEDHWNESEVHKLLAKEKWDYVIMQQGPSAGAEGRQSLIEYSRKFAEEISRSGAKPALYGVWPSFDRRQDFERCIESYQLAAKEVKGLFFPAGAAWLEAWKRDPKIELYSSDGLHPTGAGSYLAALVIYQQLYGNIPAGLDYNISLSSREEINLTKKQAETLQEAAAAANEKFAH